MDPAVVAKALVAGYWQGLDDAIAEVRPLVLLKGYPSQEYLEGYEAGIQAVVTVLEEKLKASLS